MLGACAINKVILMGRLTHDPELRQTQSGLNTCRFTIAIDRPQSTQAAQNGQERVADFISCTAFNKTAEFVSKYFNKGKLILVEGSLRTGSYDDKNHPDVKHYTTDVWVDNVSFGETKSSSMSAGSYNGGYSSNPVGGGYQQRSNSAPSPSYGESQNKQGASVSVGDFNDYEDILSGGDDLPF